MFEPYRNAAQEALATDATKEVRRILDAHGVEWGLAPFPNVSTEFVLPSDGGDVRITLYAEDDGTRRLMLMAQFGHFSDEALGRLLDDGMTIRIEEGRRKA